MRFRYRIPTSAEVPRTWATLQDPLRLAACLPGVESVEAVADGRIRAQVVTALGPVRLRFMADAQVSGEPEGHTIVAEVSLRDGRAGTVAGRFDLTVAERADDAASAELLLEADVVIGGKLGEFAQPLLRRKADQMVREFVSNVQRLLASEGALTDAGEGGTA